MKASEEDPPTAAGSKRRRRILSALMASPLLLLPELIYFAGSRAATPPPASASGTTCVVLVLGFPPREDGSPSRVLRYRTLAGIDIFREYGCRRLILSGGNPHSKHIEAEAMAELALEAGIPEESLILEKRATSTSENIRYSLPHLESADRIIIVSDSLHVHRGKRYLCAQRPDLCAKSYTASRYVPLRMFFIKWGGVVIETYSWLHDALFTDCNPPEPTRWRRDRREGADREAAAAAAGCAASVRAHRSTA